MINTVKRGRDYTQTLGLLEKPRLIPKYFATGQHAPVFSTRAKPMAVTETTENTYRILFHNQGQIYEVYARNIYQSDLYGFVEVEDYVFGNRSKMLIDPAEDRLRSEFEGVQRSYIPMHAIVRIDEVEKEGVAKITTDSGEKVTPFPMPLPKDKS
jgi:hypothetical protein